MSTNPRDDTGASFGGPHWAPNDRAPGGTEPSSWQGPGAQGQSPPTASPAGAGEAWQTAAPPQGAQSAQHSQDTRGAQGRRSGTGRAVLASALVSAVVAAAVTAVLVPPLVDATAPEAPDPTAAEPAAEAPPTPDLSELEADTSVEVIAEAVLPSVAQVEAPTGTGSAVIFTSDGYLITNAHVIGDAAQVSVTLADGQPRPAEVVASAPFADIAVLRVDEEGLPVAAFAEEVPNVGAPAVAIGSPFGFDATVTAGVVSAQNRTLPADRRGEVVLSDLIQTDAAINPGNSGGPLVNAEGEVMGINTAIVSRTGTDAGIGFAIPAGTAVSIAERLIEEGEVVPAFLGIEGANLDPRAAQQFDLDVAAGAVVRAVEPGSPADEAGLQQGDIITAIDGVEISEVFDLVGRIRVTEPGATIEITFVRDGEERSTTAELIGDPRVVPRP